MEFVYECIVATCFATYLRHESSSSELAKDTTIINACIKGQT